MTFLSARSLLTGLLAGLFLALLLQQVVPTIQLPVHQSTDVSTTSTPLHLSESMAQVLKNILGAARHRAWIGGGYGSASSLRLSPLLLSSPSASSSVASAFSTTSHVMSNQKTFFDAVKERRTDYHLNKESTIPDKQIIDIAEKAILHVPSSFNSQSTRLVVLLNKDHDQFWDFVLEVLKPMVPEEQFPKTEQKIGGFRAGYGTVSARPSRQTTFQEGLRLANLQDACGRIEPAPHASPPPLPRADIQLSATLYKVIDRLTHTRRSSATKIPTPSKISARPFPYTRTTSATGPSIPTQCISMRSGLPLKPRALAPTSSTTVRRPDCTNCM
jgi:hypothetical protein